MKEKYDHKKSELKEKVYSLMDILRSFIPFLRSKLFLFKYFLYESHLNIIEEEEFSYKIGHNKFTLDELKHGILRGN